MTDNIIDPTANVLKLVEEATKRTDDLRVAESHRVDDLRKMSTKHIKQIMKIHLNYEDKLRQQDEKHAEDLRLAEAKRIDAINAGNVNQLASLATQVINTAETLRKSQESIINAINERIGKIEQIQYKAEGKTGGRSDLWGWIFGGIAILVAILTYLNRVL